MTLINDDTVLASRRETRKKRKKRLEQFGGDLMKKVELSYEKHGWLVDGLREFDMAEFQFRVACMAEELSEYTAATTHEDRLDALVDLAVFVVGTALRHGYTKAAWDEAFNRVITANMEKVAGPVTNQRGESTFDLGKPEGWVAPELADIIDALRHGFGIGDGAENREANRRESYTGRWPERPTMLGRTADEWMDVDRDLAAARRQVEALKRQDARFVRSDQVLETKGRKPFTAGALFERIDQLEREAAPELLKELDSIPPIVREAAALCATKSQDYGAQDFAKAVYHPFGHKSYLQMLHTKLERLKSVAEQDGTNFESARDSVIDLINYAGFYGSWMDLEAGEEMVKTWTASGDSTPRHGGGEVDDRFGNELDD